MYAIATLVMNGDKYIPGAVCLAKSIKKYHSKDKHDIELVCMVTPDVPTDELERYFDHVIEVDKISVQAPNVGGKRATFIYHWNPDAPTKWNILSLTAYKKVLFMDADMIVTQDISELFQLPCPAAMFDHQITSEYGNDPLWTGRRVDDSGGFINWYKVALGLEDPKEGSKGHLEHGTQIPGSCIDKLYTHSSSQFALQGGIVLVEPNIEMLQRFKQEAQIITNSLYKILYIPGCKHPINVPVDKTLSAIDEITLTLFYHRQGHTWNHIDIRYNVSAYHMYGMWKNKDQFIKVLHYISPYKPWSTRPDGVTERDYIRNASLLEHRDPAYKLHHEVVELWWSIYEE